MVIKNTTSVFFGMLLAVAGLGAGIVLVSQPQLLSEHAQTVNYSCGSNVDCSSLDGIHAFYCDEQTHACKAQCMDEVNYIQEPVGSYICWYDTIARVVELTDTGPFCSGIVYKASVDILKCPVRCTNNASGLGIPRSRTYNPGNVACTRSR
jgi:hypothetical protein